MTAGSEPIEDAFQALRMGDYHQGWQLFEHRRSRISGPYMRCGLPEWQGESLRGRRLLLAGEQGIGDEIQFGRFLPRLKALGAEITAAVLPMNQRIFLQLGADRTVDRLAKNSIHADVAVGLLSLPLRLGLFHADDFGTTPYIASPANHPRKGIGVVWRGHSAHGNDLHRSMPSPDLLLSLPGARVIEPLGDTLDSLAQLASLEALVTVDTSWAHLAGAMGLPCHVLLTCVSTDWRWGVGRQDSPWYGSVRLHRQRQPGEWAPLVEEVRSALDQSNRDYGHQSARA